MFKIEVGLVVITGKSMHKIAFLHIDFKHNNV